MSKMKQKDAAFQAIVAVTAFSGEGVCTMTSEQRAQARAILCEGFRNGKIELTREYDDAQLGGYVSGLISNWLRKDERLNGGTKYVAKNPGSRAGMSNPEIKATKALLSTLEVGSQDHAEVQAVLNSLIEADRASKVTKTVDFSALPAGLREKFGK